MDWIKLLEDHSIPYVTRGPNTRRGEVSVQCPYCGEDDPSTHLGINLTTPNWGCLRNMRHRGRKPLGLVQALLGCSWNEAHLVLRQYDRADPDDFDRVVSAASALNLAPLGPPSAPVKMPPVRPIIREGGTARFWRYLVKRGFEPNDIENLISQYKLVCAVTGKQKDRIIIPIYSGGQLVGWTGRAIINPVGAPRYLSSDGGALKKTVFNEKAVMRGGDVLIVVEGPFDALKLDFYGRPKDIRTTCVFGTSMTIDQISILMLARKRFRKIVFLFDPDAVEQTYEAMDTLSAPNVTLGHLPEGIDDPGALSAKAARAFARSFK